MPSVCLLIGGAGYVGCHVAADLIESGYTVVIFDNFSNSSPAAIHSLEIITNQKIEAVEGDMLNLDALNILFARVKPDVVVLLAGVKAVDESVSNPLKYYQTNIVGAMNVLEAMRMFDCKNLIFSSSATVYGNPLILPITEDHPVLPMNPYGHTKAMIEQIIGDFSKSSPNFNFVNLRYFNPVGNHSSNLIGEDPKGTPNNLFPYIAKIVSGELKSLKVFGGDYKTPDGTGIRDYVHVVDIASGHKKALEFLVNGNLTFDNRNINLGTGISYSVLDVIKAWQRAADCEIPYSIAERRRGDVAVCFADAKRANDILGWKAQYNLDDMCRDHLQWALKMASTVRTLQPSYKRERTE